MLPFLEKKEALLTLLKNQKLFLTKNRGQNFLIDKNMRIKILSYIPKSKIIIEIGCGLGHWTYYLQQKTERLIGVELDQGFIPILRDNFPNAEFYHIDFLKFHLYNIKPIINKPYILCGNIPYYISTKICEHILTLSTLPEQVHIVVEKDFAQEKLSPNKDSALYRKLEYIYTIKHLLVIPAECFFPIPKKPSLYIQMTIKPNLIHLLPLWLQFISLVYTSTKKTLWNNLTSLSLLWKKEQIEFLQHTRVHQVSLNELKELFDYIIMTDKNAFQK